MPECCYPKNVVLGSMSLTNLRRPLKTMAIQKNAWLALILTFFGTWWGKNQGQWRHFGVRVFQGNITWYKASNRGRFGGDMSLSHSFCLYQFCSLLLGFSWLVPGFAETIGSCRTFEPLASFRYNWLKQLGHPEPRTRWVPMANTWWSTWCLKIGRASCRERV